MTLGATWSLWLTWHSHFNATLNQMLSIVYICQILYNNMMTWNGLQFIPHSRIWSHQITNSKQIGRCVPQCHKQGCWQFHQQWQGGHAGRRGRGSVCHLYAYKGYSENYCWSTLSQSIRFSSQWADIHHHEDHHKPAKVHSISKYPCVLNADWWFG